jgi:Flp pilus assembly protein TadB
MAETSLKEGLREVRDQARPSEINPKLEEAVQNQPLAPHLLDFKVVLKALAIGAVVALILFLLVSPMFAGVGLVLVFFGAWFGLATVSYGKAEERREAEKDSEEEEDEEEDE